MAKRSPKKKYDGPRPPQLRHKGPQHQPLRIDGERFRKARLAAGITQRALEDATGITQRVISQLEGNDRPNVRLSTAGAFARACGVTLDYLCGIERDQVTSEGAKAKLATVAAMLEEARIEAESVAKSADGPDRKRRLEALAVQLADIRSRIASLAS